ncbi:MAG: hypothetical protein JKY01_10705 [Pseudomonadales bacterium]|nr:hypothetical protein [Pseudomonadales bacterium]
MMKKGRLLTNMTRACCPLVTAFTMGKEYQIVEKQLTIDDILGAAKRRKKPAIIAFTMVLSISILYAVFASPVYKSSATILIEQQEIPQDLVRSTVTSFADQRIQMIMQKVMTFAKLSVLIKKFDLYADLREKQPLEVAIDKIRKDINWKMISADVIDPKSGRPVSASIAFVLSYKNESARTAQRVANEITTLFLSENIKNRQAMASEAEAFLSVEVVRLEKEANKLEIKLSDFKEKNLRSLPEMTSLNLNIMERTEQELLGVGRQIQSLDERKIMLEAQLSQLNPRAREFSNDTEQVLSPEARATLLQNKYVSMLAVYTTSHPDVMNTKRELDEIIAMGAIPADVLFIKKQQKMYQEEQLTAPPSRIEWLQEKHKALEDKLEAVRNHLPIMIEEADSPAYIQVATSLKTAISDIGHLKETKKALKKKLDNLELSIMAAPSVERAFRSIARDYDNTLAKYHEVKEKQLQASLAKALEQESKGERFTLIEPPMQPIKPDSPNRLMIMVLGFIFSIMTAIGLAVFVEKTDDSFYTEGLIKISVGEMPLATIPHIVNVTEKAAARQKFIIAAAGTSAAMIGVIILTHIMYLPLDVIWYALMRKL